MDLIRSISSSNFVHDNKDMKGKEWKTKSGTVFRVFEVYELDEYDASGQKPVFIKKDEAEKEVKKTRMWDAALGIFFMQKNGL